VDVGLFVEVGRGVALGVIVGGTVGVVVGVWAANSLEIPAMLSRPNHKETPITARNRNAVSMPIGRQLFLVFVILGLAIGETARTGSSINLDSMRKSITLLPHTLH
jgi:hypothetical protein